MNGYLLFNRLDAVDGERLFGLVGPDRPLRAAALGATGAPGAVAAYDALTIADARDRIDQVLAAGLEPLDHLVYAGVWEPPAFATTAEPAEEPDGEPDEEPAPTEEPEPVAEPEEPAEEPEGEPEPMKPARVFGLPVARGGVLSVTCLSVPPLKVRPAMAAAADGHNAVSPVTGGPWNLLVEHVAPDVAAVQAGIDGTYAALAAAGVDVSAGTTLYASHALFRTTNPNTPPV